MYVLVLIKSSICSQQISRHFWQRYANAEIDSRHFDTSLCVFFLLQQLLCISHFLWYIDDNVNMGKVVTFLVSTFQAFLMQELPTGLLMFVFLKVVLYSVFRVIAEHLLFWKIWARDLKKQVQKYLSVALIACISYSPISNF